MMHHGQGPYTPPRLPRPPSWNAAALAKVKPTKLHDLIASVSAIPSHNDSDDDSIGAEDEDYGGGASVDEWEHVVERIKSHPAECRSKDRRDRTPLHVALARRPPPAVVKAFLDSSTFSSADLLLRDYRGATPLCRAAEHRASAGCIRALLDANSEAASFADRSDRLPLHWACSSVSNKRAAGTATSVQAMRAKKQETDICRLLLKAYPEGASMADIWQRRAIDEAIDGKCCSDVVKLLVNAYPEAVAMDESGCTPLASAIQGGLDVETIRLLVEANPDSLKVADGSCPPLRKALEYQTPPAVIDILANNAEDVEAADSMGRTSLHLALTWSAYNFAVVEILLRKAPHVAALPNKQGVTPLCMAYQHYSRTVRGAEDIRRNDLSDKAKQAWRTALLLLRAATSGSVKGNNVRGLGETDDRNRIDDGEWKVLHEMLKTDVPISLVRTALVMRPEEVLESDASGSMALSRAICGPASCKSRIVELLIDANASAARVADISDKCRYPLAQAALRGNTIKGNTLTKLMKCFPGALIVRDQATGLYPFQMAALPKENAGSNEDNKPGSACDLYVQCGWDNDENILQVNVIFHLVRAAPNLLLLDIEKRKSCLV